jgi:uncharacterized protein UPF0547
MKRSPLNCRRFPLLVLVFIAFLLPGCGGSQKRKEGIDELERIQSSIHGLNILVAAGLALLVTVVIVLTLMAGSGTGLPRQCPYCAETIKAAAKVCRFCNHELAAV